MDTLAVTVTVDEVYIYIRSGRPEDFALEYHIQRDDYMHLDLPDNPRCVDIYLMGFKKHPQQEQIVKIVATPYLDMLLNNDPVPHWTHPVEHAPEGGIRLRYG